MKINTKYDIGHTFWVPRVRKEIQQEELVWEGETWYKDVETYVPYVKLKKIVYAEIKVGRNVGIMYGVKTYDEGEDTLSQYYPEANITNYTEEEAMSIAEEYAEQNKEYFGN
jgi:tetrahydromethanopterin S-methyltransferase subunit G